MGWVHDTGYTPAYEHEGYAVAILDGGGEAIGPSSVEARRVQGWRAGCECGWRGGGYFDRAEWPSKDGWASEDLEDGPLVAEWSEHLARALPELAVHDAAQESGVASQRLEHAVVAAKAAGVSWARIGDAAGMTRQSAHERWQRLIKNAADNLTDTPPPGLSHPTLRQLVDGSRVPAHVMPTEQAVMLARHAKAALMHLTTAEGLARDAGIDLDGPTRPHSPGHQLAALFGSALDTVEELDAWAINNARHNGGTHATHAGTEQWCHRPGGTLPQET